MGKGKKPGSGKDRVAAEARTAKNRENAAIRRAMRLEKLRAKAAQGETGANPVTGKHYFLFEKSGNTLNKIGTKGYPTLSAANYEKRQRLQQSKGQRLYIFNVNSETMESRKRSYGKRGIIIN